MFLRTNLSGTQKILHDYYRAITIAPSLRGLYPSIFFAMAWIANAMLELSSHSSMGLPE